jgi:hypothetical protein
MSHRYAVHVVAPVQSSHLVAAERERGCDPLAADISGASTAEDLERLLVDSLGIPIPSRGFDAIISLAADLDVWLPPAAGWVFTLKGIDHCDASVRATAADIWPPIIDRWRSGADHLFVVIIECVDTRAEVLRALAAENRKLKAFGQDPDTVAWVDAVPVYVDGVLDEETSAGAP